jgi:hypothetical protein
MEEVTLIRLRRKMILLSNKIIFLIDGATKPKDSNAIYLSDILSIGDIDEPSRIMVTPFILRKSS